MAAYLIAHVNPTGEGYHDYRSSFHASLEPFGGRIVFADAPEAVEGEIPPGRAILVEFADLETARAWYHSDTYQELSIIRRANSEGWLGFIEER